MIGDRMQREITSPLPQHSNIQRAVNLPSQTTFNCEPQLGKY